jgi:hypothetical protein
MEKYILKKFALASYINNNRILHCILTIVALSLTMACSAAETQSIETSGFAPMGRTTDAKSGQMAEAMVSSDVDYVNEGGSAYSDDPAQMVIKRASLQIIVKDVQETMINIEDAVTLLGGVVVSSNSSDNEAAGVSGSLQIRVPSEHLSTLLAAIKFGSVRVPHESVNSNDVTEEYIDLTARLENLELTEAQLSKLMDRTETIKEVLSVQRELTTIRGQIESLAGRIKYLETNVAMSVVHVTIYPEGSGKPITDPGWSISETIKDALRGLTGIGRTVVEGLIWIGILLPVWGTVFAIFVFGRRMVQKKRASKQLAADGSKSIED